MTVLAADREHLDERSLRLAAEQLEYRCDGEPLATWWRQLSPGTNYWRCEVPAKALPGNVLNFTRTDLVDGDLPSIPRQQGASIWPFTGSTTRAILMAALQEQGVRVLMEADDNYIVGADVVGRDWRRDLDPTDGRNSYEVHTRTTRFCDGVIVSTDNLADWYFRVNPNVFVCPNSVDPADWPEPVKKNDGVLRIGWAASHSHLVDAPLVRRALAWAAEQKNVEVWVYGIGEIVKFPGRVRKVPWTNNLEEYRRSLALCDVHICPLVETPWSAGKSDIKALESSMAGAWPIVSTATPYKPWHDRTLTATTKKDWERVLRWCVGHRDEIPRLAAEARDYVLSKRTIDKSIHLWREAVQG